MLAARAYAPCGAEAVGVEEGEARQTAGKRAEATGEAPRDVWIDDEARDILYAQLSTHSFFNNLLEPYFSRWYATDTSTVWGLLRQLCWFRY